MTQTYKVTVEDNGNVFWKNESGQLHREGGLPACEYASGTKIWFVNGERHRDGGLPNVEYTNKNDELFVNYVSVTEVMNNKCDISNKIIKIEGNKFKLVQV